MTHWHTKRDLSDAPGPGAEGGPFGGESGASGAGIAAHQELFEDSVRRVQQLLGERQQLRTRLAERDERIEELNREIGALKGASTNGRLGGGRWFEFVRRVENALFGIPGWRSSKRHCGPAALGPVACRVPLYGERAMPPILALLVCGLARQELSHVVETVLKGASSQGVLPLFLVDDDEFTPLRARRALFEYLPARIIEQGRGLSPETALYVQRRLALIRKKWQPVRALAFGRVARDVLDLWRISPFEDAGVLELTGPGVANGTGAMPTADLGEDTFGVGGPDERLDITVVRLDEAVDRSLQLDDRAEGAALHVPPGEATEKFLDRVQP